MKEVLSVSIIGVAFGFVLSRVGFTSWDEVHRMFTFSDLRLTLTFAVAIPLLALGWTVIGKLTHPYWAPRELHRGSLPGGLIFGAGWALSGACPSIALVQLGEGQLAAAWTLVGVFAGNYLYAIVRERYLHWTAATCAND